MLFQRPTGAAADVKELEYISALHQTVMPDIRPDGSIRDVDIVNFLASRYGISVSPEDVRKTVLAGLGGGDGDEDCIDLMEMVAILFIPTLIKASKACSVNGEVEPQSFAKDKSEKVDEESGGESVTNKIHDDEEPCDDHDSDPYLKPPRDLLRYVLDMILHDVTGSRKPKRLDTDLVKQILMSYGETELAEDEVLLRDMVYAAAPPPPPPPCVSNGDDSPFVDEASSKTEEQTGSRTTQVYSGPTSCPLLRLDVETFARALTGDVLLYNVCNERKWSTNYYDVFQTNNMNFGKDNEGTAYNERQTKHGSQSRKELSASPRHHHAIKLNSLFSAPSLDYVAGRYRSKTVVVLLWTCWVVTYFSYYYDTIKIDFSCKEHFGGRYEFICLTIHSIFSWLLIFWFVSFYGLFFIGLSSMGNSTDRTGVFRSVFGIVILLSEVISSFQVARDDEASAFYQVDNKRVEKRFMMVISLTLGIIVAAIKILHLSELFVSSEVLHKLPFNFWKLFKSENLRAESYGKQAAASKILTMTRNALTVTTFNDKDNVMETHFGQALLAFSKIGKQTEPVGGIRWTWDRIFSSELHSKHGVWLHARLWIGHFCQAIVTFLVVIWGLRLTYDAYHDFDEEAAKDIFHKSIDSIFDEYDIEDDVLNDALGNVSHLVTDFFKLTYNQSNYNCSSLWPSSNSQGATNLACDALGDSINCNPLQSDYLCALLNEDELLNSVEDPAALLQESGFDSNATKQILREIVDAAVEHQTDERYPKTKYMILAPLIVATIVSFLVALKLTIMFIPSVTATTLKLRCGLIPTFRNPHFTRYRIAPDQVTVLIGSVFWGCLFSSVLVGGIVGTILFLYCWQVTRSRMIKLTATLIGIITTILIKICLTRSLQKRYYVSLYRKQPGGANICALLMEAANFALSVGFVTMRMLKLFITSALYVGRVDTPFLATGVGARGNFEFDNYPTIFVKDILAHEAHRHPYIERLGAMYLMKLRYGDDFAETAGSVWRLIFVFALMPWLSKYRIMTRSDKRTNDEDEEDLVTPPGDEIVTDRSIEFVSLRKKKNWRGSELVNSEGPENSDLEEEDELTEENSDDSPPERLGIATKRKMLKMESEISRLKKELTLMKMKNMRLHSKRFNFIQNDA